MYYLNVGQHKNIVKKMAIRCTHIGIINKEKSIGREKERRRVRDKKKEGEEWGKKKRGRVRKAGGLVRKASTAISKLLDQTTSKWRE